MRLAIQEKMLPGRDLAERAQRAREFGFEGIEFWGSDALGERVGEIRRALGDAGLATACLCAGFRGSPLSKERHERQQALEDIEALLARAGELGATGVIVVPIFGQAQVPDLRPWKAAAELERELLAAELPRLDAAAAQAGCHVLLEPLNRYETHFLRTLESAAGFCAGHSHVAIMADFFHMSIEEADIARAVTAHRSLIRHVHLADSNRQLPGLGHTDFLPGFAALAQAGYTGWLSLECGVSRPAEESLPRCAAHLRQLIASAAA